MRRRPDRALVVPRTGLPVERAINAIAEALESTGTLVLSAEPGAGKSSLVPLVAANHTDARVVLLQPRRLAARATAFRLADLIGEDIGRTIGLTMRGERRVDRTTRIEVVTEAVLTNRLLADPELPGIGCVIFDEFHERSLDADLGLGMAIESRALLRPDLQIVVMSATIDTEPVSRLLDDAPVVAVPGRAHPVVTVRRQRPVRSAWVNEVAAATVEALASHPGDALIFAPGRAEVERVRRTLEGRTTAAVHALHGGTTAARQRALLRPGTERRVIVATAVAETSVTVPGVRIVIDGGLARRPRFDPTSGLGHLETVFVPRFGADQRRGRAGRTDDGLCVRLWSAEDERHLDESFEPEIVAGDPLPISFALCRWGDPDAAELPLLDHPGGRRLAAGRTVLAQLGLIDETGRPTTLGRAAGDLPVHPRSAAALLAASGTPAAAGVLTAVAALEEDLRLPGADLGDLGSLPQDRLARAASHLRRRTRHLPSSAAESQPADLVEALLDAWPDRLAAARPERPDRFQMATGSGVSVPAGSPLVGAPFLVVATAGGSSRSDLVVRAAVATDRRTVLDRLGDRITTTDVVEWDDRLDRVVAWRVQRLGAIVLHREPLPHPNPEAIREALLSAVHRQGLDRLTWSAEGRQLRARLAWLHGEDPDNWPDVSDDALVEQLERWLDLSGAESLAEVHIGGELARLLDWRQRRELDQLAPPAMRPPRGALRRIDYADGRPVWPVRIQQLFGLDEHPTVGPKRTPVVIELLTPADRPAQVTTDLPGFWRGSYANVRAELRGRYPKHAWPEDPLPA